jgi:colicin import membrane protein
MKILKWLGIGILALIVVSFIGSASTPEGREGIQRGMEDAISTPRATPRQEGTNSQQQAVRAAENYLRVMPFSRSGLIEQLEFEDYSTADATYAVDRISVNWNDQAARAAKNYLDTMPFSRQGLIDQLIFEGYTPSQAEYGVNQVGL